MLTVSAVVSCSNAWKTLKFANMLTSVYQTRWATHSTHMHYFTSGHKYNTNSLRMYAAPSGSIHGLNNSMLPKSFTGKIPYTSIAPFIYRNSCSAYSCHYGKNELPYRCHQYFILHNLKQLRTLTTGGGTYGSVCQ